MSGSDLTDAQQEMINWAMNQSGLSRTKRDEFMRWFTNNFSTNKITGMTKWDIKAEVDRWEKADLDKAQDEKIQAAMNRFGLERSKRDTFVKWFLDRYDRKRIERMSEWDIKSEIDAWVKSNTK